MDKNELITKENAIDQIRSSIHWFIQRGSSLEGYLAFYKDSHYPPKQIAEIFEADKQSDEIARKRFKNLTGRPYMEKYRLDGYGGVLEFDKKLDAYIFIGKLNNQTFEEFVEEYEFDGDIKEYKEWRKAQKREGRQ